MSLPVTDGYELFLSRVLGEKDIYFPERPEAEIRAEMGQMAYQYAAEKSPELLPVLDRIAALAEGRRGRR